ncbi:MAG TPA: FecR domain-containing protein [Methylomirabilota bacterium]|nr:FecR domain-containing protein [Methylomirabilota bacterium]
MSSTVWAQATRAGVVTTLEGNVTATRAAAPQPVALKFKDDVFQQDKITTGSESLARMLLGGKAVVTVRERSVLTITEVPGRSTIDIESGKFALAVARERMRPGEVIEIRTPNAVAGVRGSVVVTEVQGPATQPAQVTSDFYLLQGTLDAQPAAPGTRAPIGTPQTLSVLQQFRVVGLGPGTISPIRPDQLGPIRAGLQPKSKPHTEPANAAGLRADAMSTAVGLANLIGTPNQPIAFNSQATPPLPSAAQPTNTLAPITPLTSTPDIESTSKALSGSVASVGGLLTNPGFETGDFTGWTLSGAGAVISQFGTLQPPEGKFMAIIHTLTGSTLSGCSTGSECTRSSVSQSFNVNSIVTISGKGALLSNEFPSFTSSQSEFNDRFLVTLKDASGQTFTLFDVGVNQVPFVSSSGSSAGGFTLDAGGGQTDFDLGQKTVVTSSGLATLTASVSNVSDTNHDSAFILDAVSVTQDPPLFFFPSGSGQSSGTLLSVAGETRTFDSLLMVCCGASFSLTGPALDATNSNLTIPFSVVSAIQGGHITSSWPGAMVQLNGGSYTLGPIVGIFDVAGSDASDQPLRHGGVFLDATSASISSGSVLRVDTALLEATAPLLNLKSSTMLTNDSALNLSFRANVSSLGPMIALNNSTLTVAAGALVNVGFGSLLAVRGDLVQLANGSTLNLFNGPLARVTGNSTLAVSGGLVSFIGGGNTLNLNNSLCAAFSCTNLGGLNVALTGGASAANVSLTNPIQGVGTVNIGANAAAIVVSGAGSKVSVGQ